MTENRDLLAFGMEYISDDGEYLYAVALTGNSLTMAIYRIEGSVCVNLDPDVSFDLKKLGKLVRNDRGKLQVETGIHMFRIANRECVDYKHVRYFNPELVLNVAMELTIYQSYGFYRDNEVSRNQLEQSLKAEKIKDSLVWACYVNDQEKIDACLEKAKPAALNKALVRVGTPLMFCAANDNPEAFKRILEMGGKIDKKIAADDAVHLAIIHSEAIVRYLYETQNEYFMSQVQKAGFSYATKVTNRKVLDLLREMVGDIFRYDSPWPTVFVMIVYDNLEGIKYLVENGLDLQCKKVGGMTPLAYAKREGKQYIVDYLESVGAKE